MADPVTVNVVVPTLIEIFRGIFSRDRNLRGPFSLPEGISSSTPAPRSVEERELFEETNLARVREIAAANRTGGLSALPAAVPQVTPPGIPGGATRTPPIFPTGPAANDPIFRQIGVRGLGRLLGPGSILITAVDFVIEEMQRRQDERIQETIDRQDEDIANRRRRQAREAEMREVLIRGTGESDRLPLPDFPGVSRPSPPPPVPRMPSLPVELPFPDIGLPLPRIGAPGQPLPLPDPVSPPVPVPPAAPAPEGTPSERTVPQQDPLEFQFPFLLPRGLPGFTSAPGTPGLTSPQPVSVPSPLGFVTPLPDAKPVPQADTARDRCRPRRCDDDLDEDRLECFKGLYREGLRDTDFTQWVQIDCITGAEL